MPRKAYLPITGTCVLGDQYRPKKGGAYDNGAFPKRWRPVKGKAWKPGESIQCNPEWEYRRAK